jgi:hypothetical protein
MCDWGKYSPNMDFLNSLKFFGGTERSYLLWLSEIYKDCDKCHKIRNAIFEK